MNRSNPNTIKTSKTKKEKYPEWLEKQEERRAELAEQRKNREILSTAPPEPENKEDEPEAQYEYHLGDSVYIGASQYEILSFDENRVMLYDFDMPLFNKELSRESRIMGDCTGSKKQYSFRLTAENTGEVHLFECAIDLLSYATLMKLEGKDWRQFNLVSLAGVYSPKQKIEDSKVPVTLGRLLEKDKTIRRIVLHLDNDIAGRKATKALQTILSDKYEVVDDPPQYGKDVNDFLCKRLGIKDKTERSFAR